MKSLQEAISAARAAVVERSGASAVERQNVSVTLNPRIDAQYDHQGDHQGDLGEEAKLAHAASGITHTRYWTQRAVQVPSPRVLATFQPSEVVSQGVSMSKGAAQVWTVLHRLALDVARFREYTVTPGQVTFHLPAVTLAGAVGYARSHLYRLLDELTRAGLLDGGGHAQNVMGRSLYDGCLWAVRTRRDAEPPRVRADEWRHQWRPGFTADVQGKTGAAAEKRQLQTQEADAEEYYQAAKHRAAIPDAVFSPAESSCPIPERPSLNAVADALGGIWGIHVRHRARRVGQLASAMCAALGEPERRRYWCRVIWEAYRASIEGRSGLQGLAAQVARLAADLKEGAPWRSPGAVLASRLKGTC